MTWETQQKKRLARGFHFQGRKAAKGIDCLCGRKDIMAPSSNKLITDNSGREWDKQRKRKSYSPGCRPAWCGVRWSGGGDSRGTHPLSLSGSPLTWRWTLSSGPKTDHGEALSTASSIPNQLRYGVSDPTTYRRGHNRDGIVSGKSLCVYESSPLSRNSSLGADKNILIH